MTAPAEGSARDGRAVTAAAAEVALLALAALLLLAFLWTGSLVDSDDAIYADIARTMARTGDWLDLRWHGAVLHEKPPLFFWLVAGAGTILGFDDFAVRLPAALSALGALVLVGSIAGRLGLDRRARLLAIGLTLASGCFYFTGRRVLTDPTLVFFGLLSLDAWLAARDRPRRLVLWGAALGAAVLTKWVAAAPFLLVAVADGLLPARPGGRSPLRTPWLLAGGAAFLLVAAPWHVAQGVRHGAAFWSVYAGYHVLARATTALVTDSSPLFYATGAWLREGALALAWAAGLAVLTVRLVASRGRDRAARWLAVWLLVTLVPIHLAATRLYHYLLPAVPALALATSLALGRALRRDLVAAAAALFVAAAFVLNNGLDLAAPDYSPGTKALAPALRAAPPDAVVAAYEVYDVAATWYAERPVPFWTTRPALHDVWAVDMMVRADAIRLATPQQIAALVRAAPAAALLVPPPLAAEARAYFTGVTETAEAADRALVTGAHAPR